jgi:NAD(P)-dependent dehydrogenase (short-subunit alcohol dehydrogenase family)
MAPSPQDKNSVSSCEKAYFTNEFDIMVTRLNRFVAETFRTCVKGMRVNAIRPGYVHGTAKIPSLPHGDRDRIVLRRVGHIDEVASAACFLASQDASYVTGVVLKVDGGFQTDIFK